MESVLVKAKAAVIAAGAGICSLGEPELLARLEALYLEGVQSGFNINAGINNEAIPHPDDLAVDKFAEAMKKKMAVARSKGRAGWENKIDCPAKRLQQFLSDHLAKGDPVDVGNFAMMLFNRDERTAEYDATALFHNLLNERDNAWQELRQIRELIEADFEESTFDEVSRVINKKSEKDSPMYWLSGVEDAAKWIDKRREAFESEHGSTDPDTGSFEYGSGSHAEAKRDYVNELYEIAEGLRELKQSRFGGFVLEKPVRIGGANFMPGVQVKTAIDAAHRLYLASKEPVVEAERIEKARAFITLMQGDPDKCRQLLESTLSMLRNCTVESGVCMCGEAMDVHKSEDHMPCDAGAHFAEQLDKDIKELLESGDYEKAISQRETLTAQAEALHAIGHLLGLPAGSDITLIPAMLRKVGFYWVNQAGQPDAGGAFLKLPDLDSIRRARFAGCEPVYLFALQSGVSNNG